MAWCDRGIQMLLATVGAFVAFSLMSIAIGTDYWLYSRAYICNATNITSDETQTQPKKVRGDLTHSGLWRICCIEGIGRFVCFVKGERGSERKESSLFLVLRDGDREALLESFCSSPQVKLKCRRLTHF